jgi:1,4-dihydroxy-2-naphthoate polyprenyltransferase
MSKQETVRSDESRPGNLALFLRLTRAQFLPLIVLPAIVGTAYAFYSSQRFNPLFFALVLLGVVLLHLGANAIDDAYDFQNGVDKIANSTFPKDFGGWKPIPRGYISLERGKFVSFLLLAAGIVVGIYFWYTVGYFAVILAIIGTLLAIFYCAPPLKLDYRGLGLGEAAIFFTFGPIPVLGTYYVQTGSISLDAFLVSVPIGLMTVTILMDHDLIFYEVYKKSGKLSLSTVLGRRKALIGSALITVVAFGMILGLVAAGILPIWCTAAPLISGAVLLRKRRDYGSSDKPPPFYVPFTVNALYSDWLFSLFLAIGILV